MESIDDELTGLALLRGRVEKELAQVRARTERKRERESGKNKESELTTPSLPIRNYPPTIFNAIEFTTSV